VIQKALANLTTKHETGAPCPLPETRAPPGALFERVRTAAFDIISRKGYTNTAIGLVIAYVVRVMLGDQRSVLPVSVNPEGDYGQHDVCFSVPCVVGARGVEYRLAPEVNDAERQGLEASAQMLRESLQGMTIESAS